MRSSGRKLLQYIFTIPALFSGAFLVMCLIGPHQPGDLSAFLVMLLPFGFMSCLMALIYGGRFAEITGEGNWLTLDKPYAFVDQQQRIDLTTVRQVSLSGYRVQDKYLSFWGDNKDERSLLLVRIVPPAVADLAALADFLHGRGINTNF